MRSISKHALFATLALSLAGCDQWAARTGVGSMTIHLDCDRVLTNVTWKKDGELWILSRPMREDETPTNYAFKAKSMLGILEGEVKLIEERCR